MTTPEPLTDEDTGTPMTYLDLANWVVALTRERDALTARNAALAAEVERSRLVAAKADELVVAVKAASDTGWLDGHGCREPEVFRMEDVAEELDELLHPPSPEPESYDDWYRREAVGMNPDEQF